MAVDLQTCSPQILSQHRCRCTVGASVDKHGRETWCKKLQRYVKHKGGSIRRNCWNNAEGEGSL